MMTLNEIKEILRDDNPRQTEDLARRAAALTRQYFGRTIVLYAPLYLSNYCSSHCLYCGFSAHQRIHRIKLTAPDMYKEMAKVASTGIENILLLTGESYQVTPLSYLMEAVNIAKKYFTAISLEVHPMETEEYHQLFLSGVDGITLYQETYNRERYSEVHLAGKKKDYGFRRSAPQRMAQAGIRQIALGILLGLDDAAQDLFALFKHLQEMERTFPGVEYSLSFPRLRKIKGEGPAFSPVDDKTFIKILCLTRLCFPRVGINLSTRENPLLRDPALELGITRLSAGSKTSVGGYSLEPPQGQEPQFDIEDNRSVREIIQMLKEKNFDPVFTDWRPIANDFV